MIMIYGPAGSGKSTQGAILAEKVNGRALSVGQICRDNFAEYTKTAAMVPEDELAIAVLKEVKEAEDAGYPVVLDGQPWSEMSGGSKILSDKTNGVIIIDVPREESIKRLSSRGRDDDQLSNWNKKLDMYEPVEALIKNDALPGGESKVPSGVGSIPKLRPICLASRNPATAYSKLAL